jgi:hypothetical protein
MGTNKKAELFFRHHGNQVFVGAQFRYEDGRVKEQIEFFENMLAQAELPGLDELPKILVVSQANGLASTWRRSRASTLENNAAALLTALAFVNQKQQIILLKDFFRAYGFKTGSRGRSHVHPDQAKDVVRGHQIDRLMGRLQDGFRLARLPKRIVKLDDVTKRLRTQLGNMGYDEQEIEAILKGRTLQDAAYRQYHQTVGNQENVDLKAIQNSYSRFKKLRRKTQSLS